MFVKHGKLDRQQKTKAVLRSFMRTQAAEFKDHGIRVNMVSPGVIEILMLVAGGQFIPWEEIDAATEQLIAITPLGRIGRPEEIASAVPFLTSLGKMLQYRHRYRC